MFFEFSREISDDYEKLVENEKDYDVIIYAGENENVKEIHAHSLILCTRSQYFRGAFSNEWVKKENGKFIFKKPNISSQLFKIILRFIYCGKVDLTKLQVSEILKLLMAVDELNIPTLISCIQEYLIKDQEHFLQQNLLEIFQTVYQHEPFKDLLNYCLKNIKIILDPNKPISLETPLLEFLLKHDDLNLNETEIWESLIKWGLMQDQTLNQDISKWNKDDFNTFKEIIYGFIPLIRFCGISSEDYFNKVKPYEEILPKELKDDILKFHMVSGHKLSHNLSPRYFVDSTLINQKHIALFASWVKGRIYKFNLLYRASRDGNTASAFHNKCDNNGATITVAKVTNSEQIVGGYNPLSWDSNSGWKSTYDSFIFSFTSKNNLQSAKVGYSNGNENSLCCSSSYGPIFGGGQDLYCDGFCNWYNNGTCSYPKLDIPTGHFNVDDYEVFQVVKK